MPEPPSKPPKAVDRLKVSDDDERRSDSDINVRLPTLLRDRLRELAAAQGRSTSEVVKWSLILFDTQVQLAYLVRPDTRAQMGADANDAAIAEVKRDLHEFTRAALNPPVAARVTLN